MWFVIPELYKLPIYVFCLQPHPMPVWAQDNIAASTELSMLEAIATDLLDMSKRRRDMEEALHQQMTRAVSAQPKGEEDFWMEHDTTSEG